MMTTTIGDLAVRIGADTEGFSRGMKRTKRQLGDLSKKVRKGTNDFVKYSAAATAAGTALAAGLAVKSARAAKEINNLSRLSNESASEFQKMAFGARSVGIEQDKLSDILKDVNDRVGDFITTGGGPMADFFEKIAPAVGVTAEQFQKLSGPDALQLYVDSLEKANLSQAEMTFFMEAMASDATALLPLLRNNGEAMAEQAREAEALGVALSDLDTQRLAQLGEELDKSGDVIGSLADQMSADFAPVLQAVNAQFLDMVKELGGVDDVSETVFNNIIDGAAFVANAIQGISAAAQLTAHAFGAVGNTIGIALNTIASTVINGPVSAVNYLIESINSLTGTEIPTVSFSEWGKAVNNMFDQNVADLGDRMADMERVLNTPIDAGETFKNFVNEAQKSSDQVAAIRNEARAKELVQQEDFDTYLNDLIAGGQEILTEVERKNAQERTRLAEQEAAAREAALGGALANLAVLMQSESKKMFKIGKAAAIAQTLVSTYTGAQESYAALAGIPVVGPALGTAAAAAAIAAGFVRLQAIKAQQFGGGAARSGAAAGGAGVAPPQVGSATAGGGLGAQTIGVTGIDPNQLFRGDQIIDLINTAQENGARLVIQQ